MSLHEDKINELLSRLELTDEGKYNYFHESPLCVPDRREVITLVKHIQCLMFPRYFKCDALDRGGVRAVAELTFALMKRQITAAFCFLDSDAVVDTEALADELMGVIPTVKEKLIKDVQAIYEGDPAARSPEEVILAYPGFYAISVYRIAHEFYIRKIPYISRIMTEFAHEKTGVDIHAGATVGEYFCIDHGTGIVIGETTTIGDRVKLYQGVTLGAKSFELGEDGNPIKGTKRHPDIGNNCVIYAGATILGGRTKIGDGCVIGGNVWLTHSVEDGTTVYYQKENR